MKPRALDLFCCAGGATRGYQLAGFDVTGVDLVASPNYCGDAFVEGDALEYLREHGAEYDFIHASPPCQRYSRMTNCRAGLADEYPDLVGPTRELLDETGIPYVIENVVGAPLRSDVVLCGRMFGLDLYRHRVFESNVALCAPEHLPHDIPASRAGHWRPGTIMSVSGHVAPVAEARRAMGIDWMRRDELAEAIPPAYAHFIGGQFLSLGAEAAA